MNLTRCAALLLVLSLTCIAATPALGAATRSYAAQAYGSKCQVCHGIDGKGNTPSGKKLGVKDFHSPEVVKASDEELFKITKQGKNKMPAYDKKLTDDQIKSLIAYIRKIK